MTRSTLPSGIYRRFSVYWIDLRVNGRRLRKPGGRTLSEAMMERARLLAESRDCSPTLAVLAHRYVAHLEITARPGTARVIPPMLWRWIAHFGDRPVEFLTIDDLRSYLAERLKSVKPITANADLKILRACLRLAVEDGILERLPFRIQMLRVPQRSPVILRGEEVRRLVAAAPEHLRPLLVFAANTGLRAAELCHVRWEDIDTESQVLRVACQDGWQPKSGRDRLIPLNAAAVAAVLEARTLSNRGRTDLRAKQRLGDRERFVFLTSLGMRWSPNKLARAVTSTYVRAGMYRRESLPGIHQLRRTFLSTAAHAGADVETLRELAGHSSIVTTQRYLATREDVKRRAVDRLVF